MPTRFLSRLITSCTVATAAIAAAAAAAVAPAALAGADDVAPRIDPDRDHDTGPGMPRGVLQLLVGSSGFEPGVAAEWRWPSQPRMQVRPEVFINDDGRVGAAVSLDWELRSSANAHFALPPGQDIFIGPRVAYHNRDHDGWEIGAIGIYSLALDPFFRAPQDRDAIARRAPPSSHFLEIIGDLGVVEHKHPDDVRFAGTLGLAFAYQF